MDTKNLLELVGDFSQWRGDVYRLAAFIAAKQRETDAAKAIHAGQPELAESILQPTNAPKAE
jgi:hypothetical protein